MAYRGADPFKLTLKILDNYCGWFALTLFALSNIVAYLSVLGFLPPMRLSVLYIFLLCLILGKFVFNVYLYGFKPKLTFLQFIGWILVIWVVTIHLIWYSEILSVGGDEEFWKNAAQTFLLALLMWLIGLTIGSRFEDIQKLPSVRSLLWLVFIMLSGVILLGVWMAQKKYGIFVFFFKNTETGQVFNYLVMGDLIAICSLLLMGSYQIVPLVQFLIYLLASSFLFLSFSRTSFFLFILWGMVHIWYSLKDIKARFLCIMFLMVLVLSLLIIFIVLGDAINTFKSVKAVERMMSIIVQPLSDTSLQGRLMLLREGVDYLRHNWLLGQYMAEWWKTGELGGYIHNWLSFIVAYGIGPFILFTFLIILLLVKGYNIMKKKMMVTPIVLLLFASSAIIIARSYVWPFIWFIMGLLVNYKKGEKRENCHSFSLELWYGKRGL
ncbi:O-antigen ligase family protein [Desulfofundulus salinus]|uniref:O-antigen ligase-related domain-containing protein n=1 Tax=Desulfofundulus salinus TaxID=2419843 RepID=A0A494WS02_9FIRM|nr:O-antigen ligase family protein [Desulfofundulus salinum]RKO65483.1 hypothetical protein D7024_14530 [Desulfofundulus salinum]